MTGVLIRRWKFGHSDTQREDSHVTMETMRRLLNAIVFSSIKCSGTKADPQGAGRFKETNMPALLDQKMLWIFSLDR